MLSKHCLANSAEIILAKEEGRLFSGFLFSFLVFDLGDDRLPRFAFVVSTKIDKRAVKRNRAKRLLKASIKFLFPRIKKGVIVVFLARKAIVGKDLASVRVETEKMFEKARLID